MSLVSEVDFFFFKVVALFIKIFFKYVSRKVAKIKFKNYRQVDGYFYETLSLIFKLFLESTVVGIFLLSVENR